MFTFIFTAVHVSMSNLQYMHMFIYTVVVHLADYTFNSAYKKNKYAEILLHYRWLFIKGDIIIGEWGIFGGDFPSL